MQCRRCGFENMPGAKVCMKCNSAMAATKKINVKPPRAGMLRFVRPLQYWWNRMRSGAEQTKEVHPATDKRALFWMAISVVPGLGHLVSHRLGAIWWQWPVWFVLWVSGLLFAGTPWGAALLGLAVGMHTWIAMDAADIRGLFETAQGRFFAVATGFCVLYFFVYGSFAHYFLGGYITPGNIGSHNIVAQDYVLFSYFGGLRRGDLVTYKIRGRGPQVNAHYQMYGGQTFGRLLAFPGEKVLVGHGVFTIKSPDGQSRQYVMPGLEKIFSNADNMDFELDVPSNSYLCYPVDATIQTGGMMTSRRTLEFLGVVRDADLHGRAFMVYNTFRHVRDVPRRPLEEKSLSTK